jgi:heme-degrading monooxygenase HmoA
MYINVSRYAGAAGKMGEAAPKAQQGFVSMLKNQKGFLGYAAFASEQGDIVALHLWENAEALENSRDKIREWVSSNLPDFEEPTERFHGPVGHHALASPKSGGQGQSLYCMVRKADSNPTEGGREVRTEMADAVQKVPGFRGAYWMRAEDDPTRSASILFFDTREHANTAHEAAMAVLQKHRPNLTVRVAASGKTAILAMA